ncbi:hypothetical protein [Paraburkholderia sp. J10-1]|uniref:hypothetical protein n=1 Tax=Paraburkholderia sp. J10-1 TaxID=2805430 RepID=UPI002AB76EB0|nr:hypothetical protein [Paraburkholderia sp. J10-1]
MRFAPDETNETNMRISETIQALQKVGLTQVAIAKELGCQQANVSYHLNGRRGGRARSPRPSEKFVSGLRRLVQRYADRLDLPAGALDE